jgi:hypothetical protein
MNFTAVLTHGYGAGLFMSSETVTHGTDFCIDVICRTMQMVYEQRVKKGHGGNGDHDEDDDADRYIRFPRHLVIQSDNTVSQCKNQYFALFLAWLVSVTW